MRLFNAILLVFIFNINLQAISLSELIHSTLENNKNLKSLSINDLSKQKEYRSVSNIYNPIFSLGSNITKLDGNLRSVQIGTTSSAFALASINIYSGGKNNAIKKQKEYEFKSSQLNTITTIKETILQVITLFFQTKTVSENIIVLQEKSKALKAQYDRIKQKYDIHMTTVDEVLKLQSEYESNNYMIEEFKYQKYELLKTLELITSSSVTSLDDSTLREITNLKYISSETIKALQMNIKIIDENKNIILSSIKPQIKLENKFSTYDYSNYNKQILSDLPDQQNQLMLSVNFKLFDTSTKDKVEASKLRRLAQTKTLNYLKDQEKIKFDLAKQNLYTQKLKLISLKSTVAMGNSVYDIIKIKYQNGIVDNITYLDALSKKTYNVSLYKQALNDYEIAKANLYFISGMKYKDILSYINM
ncbi:MAG: TolC family protein [Campylobacteraceae bacterium]|jgi:outer membrane protein TolC|nr:TolC family protein [Campylobacteraceae bacterium]MBT3882832.1 TolC family protein [Campylobacteraceae bacterium]MBT4029909.1 TolC family protein [Campylobacteraceae bacterium]MBT4178868.1 TolC family protein [Campylobacteraceae bacterium]MBT4572538.1 TolC family protein [Campylobacteraceae bacterium]